jgi:hypothetical protein
MYTVQFTIFIEGFVSILARISVFRISLPICKHERFKCNCSSRLYRPRCSDRVVSSGGTQMASFRTGVVVRSGEQDGQVTKLPVQIYCLETFSFQKSHQTVMLDYNIRTLFFQNCIQGFLQHIWVCCTNYCAFSKKGGPVTCFVGIGHRRF